MIQLRRFHPALLAAAFASVSFGGLAWSRPDDKPKKIALLVGVNQYDKRGFAEQPLHSCASS
jgi:hypothetical protein